MIRVLHIVSSLSTGSGVLSMLMSYHRQIDRERIQFDYLSFRESENTFEKEIVSLGGKVFHCSKPSAKKSFFREIQTFFEAHSGEYLIVHCHPIYSAAIFASAAQMGGAKHIIQHSHTTSYSDKPISLIRNMIIQLFFGRKATEYMACSEKAKKLFWWVDAAKIPVLANAIDSKKFTFSNEKRYAIRKDLGISDDTIVIGHVGRFAPAKNHAFLIDLFKRYVLSVPDAVLLLVGDGEQMPQIKQLAEKQGIRNRTIFVGRKNNVSDYYSAMDLFVLPSRFEGLGIVLLEAQANGLPCVASTGVPREVAVTERIHFLSLKKGPQKWSALLQSISPEDVENRKRVSLPLNYSIESSAEKLMQYYDNLLTDCEET